MSENSKDILVFKGEYTFEGLVVEMLFWSGVYYVLFSKKLRTVFENYFVKQPYFDEVKKRGGVLAKNAADDMVLLFVLASHHLTGGLVMLIATVIQDGDLWVHGALIETGFELVDTISLVFNIWPYSGGQMRPDIRAVFAFHHLPGLCLIIPIVLNELHHSPNLKQIGASLLLAGGVSALVGGLVQTRDFKTQMHHSAGLQVACWAYLLYARAWVFPIASLAFLEEIKDLNANENVILGCKIGVGALGLFNVVLCLVVTEKTFRYVRKALPGGEKVELDDGEVSTPVGDYDAILKKNS